MDYIDTRLAENVRNAEVILAEIKALGYTGSRSMLLSARMSLSADTKPLPILPAIHFINFFVQPCQD